MTFVASSFWRASTYLGRTWEESLAIFSTASQYLRSLRVFFSGMFEYPEMGWKCPEIELGRLANARGYVIG